MSNVETDAETEPVCIVKANQFHTAVAQRFADGQQLAPARRLLVAHSQLRRPDRSPNRASWKTSRNCLLSSIAAVSAVVLWHARSPPGLVYAERWPPTPHPEDQMFEEGFEAVSESDRESNRQ